MNTHTSFSSRLSLSILFAALLSAGVATLSSAPSISFAQAAPADSAADNSANKIKRTTPPKQVVASAANVNSATVNSGIGSSEEFLFKYFLAEIAGQRGEAPLAFGAMFDLAQRTRDPRMARRAAEIALQANQADEAREAVFLWLELEPQSQTARQVLARMAGADFEASKKSLASWLFVANNGLNKEFNKSFMSANKSPVILMQSVAVLSRFPDKAKNLAAVRDLAKPYPQFSESHYALGAASFLAGDMDAALIALNEALKLKPTFSQAAIVKAQVLREAKKENAEMESLNFLQSYVKANPSANDARLVYARLLASQKSFLSAREEFRKVDLDNANKKVSDPESSFAIALISLQMEDYDDAEKQFLRTLDANPRDSNPVFYNLGLVTDAKKEFDAAIGWYRRVSEGEYFIPAKLKAASLIVKRDGLAAGRQYLKGAQSAETDTPEIRTQLVLAEAQLLRDAKSFNDAFLLLSDAIKQNPDAADLIYDRAMIAEKLNKFDAFEADLKRVIALKPDYAHAYNALGYTLADRNVRLEESYQLIQKALMMLPDDLSIQDSLGWVQFRMGRIDEALAILSKVYKARRDPEIAAHLGEVLWAAGRKNEAQKIWQEALKENPTNDVLVALIIKFAPK